MAPMLPTVFWILEGYRKLYEVRPTSPTLRLHPFADMSDVKPPRPLSVIDSDLKAVTDRILNMIENLST